MPALCYISNNINLKGGYLANQFKARGWLPYFKIDNRMATINKRPNIILYGLKLYGSKTMHNIKLIFCAAILFVFCIAISVNQSDATRAARGEFAQGGLEVATVDGIAATDWPDNSATSFTVVDQGGTSWVLENVDWFQNGSYPNNYIFNSAASTITIDPPTTVTGGIQMVRTFHRSSTTNAAKDYDVVMLWDAGDDNWTTFSVTSIVGAGSFPITIEGVTGSAAAQRIRIIKVDRGGVGNPHMFYFSLFNSTRLDPPGTIKDMIVVDEDTTTSDSVSTFFYGFEVEPWLADIDGNGTADYFFNAGVPTITTGTGILSQTGDTNSILRTDFGGSIWRNNMLQTLGFTFEAKVNLLGTGGEGSNGVIGFNIENQFNEINVDIGLSHIRLQNALGSVDYAVGVDNTGWHTYRAAWVSGEGWYIWRDGILVDEVAFGKMPDSRIHGWDNESFFGDFSGTLVGDWEMEYVSLDNGGAFAPPAPNSGNLVTWYDASNATSLNSGAGGIDGVRITNLQDISGNGVHLTGSGGNKPEYKVNQVNGLPALDFDGTARIFGGSLDLPSPKVVFVVTKVSATGTYIFDGSTGTQRNALIAGTNGNPGKWVSYNGGGDYNTPTSVAIGVWQVHALAINANDIEHYINGQLVHSQSGIANGIWQMMVLGARVNQANRLVGQIGEMLVYDTALNTTDTMTINNYLLTKWIPNIPPEMTITQPTVTLAVAAGTTQEAVATVSDQTDTTASLAVSIIDGVTTDLTVSVNNVDPITGVVTVDIAQNVSTAQGFYTFTVEVGDGASTLTDTFDLILVGNIVTAGTPDPDYPYFWHWSDAGNSDSINGPGAESLGVEVDSLLDLTNGATHDIPREFGAGTGGSWLPGQVNGLPAVKYDGTEGNWGAAGSAGEMQAPTNPFTLIVVTRLDAFTEDGCIVSGSSSNSGMSLSLRTVTTTGTQYWAVHRRRFGVDQELFLSDPVTVGEWNVHTMTVDGTTVSHYIDGNLAVTGSVSTVDPMGGTMLGANGAGGSGVFSQSSIAEYMVYAGNALSAGDQTAVEDYLLAKYALGNSPPTITLNNSVVAGIGATTNADIGIVTDAEDANAALTLAELSTPPAGVTVVLSNVGGTVNADITVGAAVSPQVYTMTVEVTDSGSLTSQTTIDVSIGGVDPLGTKLPWAVFE